MRATEPSRTAARRLVHAGAGLVLALAMAAGRAAGGEEPPALEVSADGSEVINAKAGIAWSRCVEGMQWSGRACVGAPQYLDHAHALSAAAARRDVDGKSWRLPRVPELRHIADAGARSPKQDPRPFPGAPEDWYWTSSTTLDTSHLNQYEYGNVRKGVTNDNMARISFLHFWAVHVATGESDGDVTKRSRLVVRLVRSL